MRIRIKLREKKILEWFLRERGSWIVGLGNLSQKFGWGNGYVKLPVNHPCYGLGYDEIHDKYDIDVHGGLTYAEEEEENGYKRWVVGFDTAHFNDNPVSWPKLRVERETIRLRDQLEKLW